ncbi:MAG: hypothetical protein GY868_20935, partial [Deltaproteobacteria bacterium]|nr:hypothetical protein [Deltaproteobacteria bacterium]
MKDFIDRMLPIFDPRVKKDDNGHYHHLPRYESYPDIVVLSNAEDGGDYEQINDALIATKGAAYKFVDEDVENRTRYWYILEDVDFNGVSTVHEPVKAVPRKI